MPSFDLTINGTSRTVDAPGDMPLLWALRDRLGLRGTKFGCGRGLCGACTVLLGDSARRSCVTPISAVGDRPVLTIEGLSPDGRHPLQRAWIAEGAPQCGYCHPGQIMTFAGMLRRNPRPDDATIDRTAATVLCRCGTYLAIRRAVRRALEEK